MIIVLLNEMAMGWGEEGWSFLDRVRREMVAINLLLV